MSLFILDTDILSLYQEGHVAVTQRILTHRISELAVPVITVEEQLSGWYRVLRRAKRRPDLADAYQRLAEAVPFLAQFAILRFEQLLAAKLDVRKSDLRIAAIALEYGGTLVSRNLRDFHRVPGLAVEDWSK